MIAALLLLLTPIIHAGVVRAPITIGGLQISGASATPAPMPSYLSVANPADAVQLAGILHAAQAAPTAVAVLASVARAAEVRGRPFVIEVVKMKESGTYNLDWGILSLRRGDLKDGPRANVATLIHELQHLLQTQHELPSNLLETELESYVVDFRVSREMNEKPKRGSYDERAQAAFKNGLEPFMDYLRKEYPEDAQLHKTRSRDYEAHLRRGLTASTAKLERLEKERTANVLVLEQMKNLGSSRDELKNYHQDTIAPLDAKISTTSRVVKWALKDIALLTSPELRTKARAYARSVIRRARQLRLEQDLVRVPERRGLARVQADLRHRPAQIQDRLRLEGGDEPGRGGVVAVAPQGQVRGVRPRLVTADKPRGAFQRSEALIEPDPHDARFFKRVERAHAAVHDLKGRDLRGGADHQLLDLRQRRLRRLSKKTQGRVHVARVHPADVAAGTAQARDGLGGGRFDLLVCGDGDEQAHKKLNYSS